MRVAWLVGAVLISTLSLGDARAQPVQPPPVPEQPPEGDQPPTPVPPGQPGQPVQPGQPPQPGQPLPGQPPQPGQPLPGQPPQPGQPVQPGQPLPGQPIQPGQPVPPPMPPAQPPEPQPGYDPYGRPGQAPQPYDPYAQPQQAYDPYAQPGYPRPGYPRPGYPREAVPTEPPPEPCCLWSIRYDPFDLIFRRVTFEAEIAWGDLPFSVELVPSYIFDHISGNFDAKGAEIGARVGWFVQGDPLEGFFLKAQFSYEYMKATYFNLVRDGSEPEVERVGGIPDPEHCDDDSAPGTCNGTVNTFVVGLMIGMSTVFPSSGGFGLTGSIGLGATVTPEREFRVLDDANYLGSSYVFNDGFTGRLRLLGSVGLGVTF